MLNTLTPSEQHTVLRMLDHGARSDIEIFCRVGQYEQPASCQHIIWIDIGALPDDPAAREITEHAIWWCRKRGLITCHPINHNLVRFAAPYQPEGMH